MRILLLPALALAAASCQPSSPEPDREAVSESSPLPSHPADETGDRIPSVDNADYFLLKASVLSDGNVVALSRRDSSQRGSVYSKREFQCEKGLVRYLGSGDTRAAAEESQQPPDEFGKLVKGSSAYLTAQVACGKYKKPVTAPIS
jgi:hypothetical protein